MKWLRRCVLLNKPKRICDASKRLEIIDRLSPRETQVANLLARGQSNKLIAQQLKISEKTVHIHRQNIMEKAEISSAAELARLMIKPIP